MYISFLFRSYARAARVYQVAEVFRFDWVLVDDEAKFLKGVLNRRYHGVCRGNGAALARTFEAQGVERGRCFLVNDVDGRHLRCQGQEVLSIVRCLRLPVFVIDHFFKQGIPDPVYDTAMRLSGRRWKMLQRLVYFAAIATVLHWIFVHNNMGAALTHFVDAFCAAGPASNLPVLANGQEPPTKRSLGVPPMNFRLIPLTLAASVIAFSATTADATGGYTYEDVAKSKWLT